MAHLNQRTLAHLGLIFNLNNNVLGTSQQGKPVEATPKYLPTIKYCLKSSQPVLTCEALAVHAVMRACQPLCRKKKNRVIPVVTYRAYPQMSKMADNLRFQTTICNEIKEI